MLLDFHNLDVSENNLSVLLHRAFSSYFLLQDRILHLHVRQI